MHAHAQEAAGNTFVQVRNKKDSKPGNDPGLTTTIGCENFIEQPPQKKNLDGKESIEHPIIIFLMPLKIHHVSRELGEGGKAQKPDHVSEISGFFFSQENKR